MGVAVVPVRPMHDEAAVAGDAAGGAQHMSKGTHPIPVASHGVDAAAGQHHEQRQGAPHDCDTGPTGKMRQSIGGRGSVVDVGKSSDGVFVENYAYDPTEGYQGLLLHAVSHRLAEAAYPVIGSARMEAVLMCALLVAMIISTTALVRRDIDEHYLLLSLLLYLPGLQRATLIDLRVLRLLLRQFEPWYLLGNWLLGLACISTGVFTTDYSCVYFFNLLLSSVSILFLDSIRLPPRLRFLTTMTYCAGIFIYVVINILRASPYVDYHMKYGTMTISAFFHGRLLTIGVFLMKYAFNIWVHPDNYVMLRMRLLRMQKWDPQSMHMPFDLRQAPQTHTLPSLQDMAHRALATLQHSAIIGRRLSRNLTSKLLVFPEGIIGGGDGGVSDRRAGVTVGVGGPMDRGRPRSGRSSSSSISESDPSGDCAGGDAGGGSGDDGGGGSGGGGEGDRGVTIQVRSRSPKSIDTASRECPKPYTEASEETPTSSSPKRRRSSVSFSSDCVNVGGDAEAPDTRQKPRRMRFMRLSISSRRSSSSSRIHRQTAADFDNTTNSNTNNDAVFLSTLTPHADGAMLFDPGQPNYAYNEHDGGYEGMLLHAISPRLAEWLYPYIASPLATNIAGVTMVLSAGISTLPYFFYFFPLWMMHISALLHPASIQRLCMLDLRVLKSMLLQFETWYIIGQWSLMLVCIGANMHTVPMSWIYDINQMAVSLNLLVLDAVRLPPRFVRHLAMYGVAICFGIGLPLSASLFLYTDYNARLFWDIPVVPLFVGRCVNLGVFFIKYTVHLWLRPDTYVVLSRPVRRVELPPPAATSPPPPPTPPSCSSSLSSPSSRAASILTLSHTTTIIKVHHVTDKKGTS